MKRFHVHVAVDDLKQAIDFYSALFAAKPSVIKTDYAKWMLDDPRVKFAISTRARQPGLDHLGIQAESGDELEEIYASGHSICGRTVHHGGLLVHRVNIVRQSCRDHRPRSFKYLCRHRPGGRACLHRRSACRRGRRHRTDALAISEVICSLSSRPQPHDIFRERKWCVAHRNKSRSPMTAVGRLRRFERTPVTSAGRLHRNI
jgi:hypothetical protein